MKFILVGAWAAVIVLLGACESTRVQTVWKSPDPPPAEFTKIAALVVNATPSERRAAEDQLAAEIHVAKGVPAYPLIADDDLKDREKVKQSLRAAGADGAVVLRLVSSDTQHIYTPPTYSARWDFYGGPMYGAPQRGYTTTIVTVYAEISVYSVPEARLLWAGSTSTDDPANIKDLVHQVARAAAEELKKQGLLK